MERLKERKNIEIKYGITAANPKSVLREYGLVAHISSEKISSLLAMINDRNMTSPTYNEELAEEIANRINQFYLLMNEISQSF